MPLFLHMLKKMKICYLFIDLIFFISTKFWLSGCSSNTITPGNPNKTVVLSHNSTKVEFRWRFTLKRREEIKDFNIQRNVKYKGATRKTFLVRFDVDRNYSISNSSLYTFTHNYTKGSLSGYFSFTIKDITRQEDNTDGSKFKYLSDELSYLLEINYLNDREFRRESKIQLWILSVPRIYYLTRERYAKQGDSITLRCNASGHPAPRATWIHKGTNTVIANSSVTSFNFTGKASGGKYCCHVTNLCGDATNCTSVSVMEIPWIVTRWHHPVTTNETNKTFECNATGIPKPNITWYYTTNNTAVDSENRKLLEIKNEDCRNVTLEYYCMAVNNAGKAKTNLTVKAICTTKDRSKDKGNEDDSTPTFDDKREIIIVVIVCILVIFLFALVLLLIFISRKRKRAKRDIIRGRQQRDSRQNQVIEECPYGEPIDAIQLRSGTPASGSNVDYATVEETGYRRVKNSNHFQEPRHGNGSSSNKAKPTQEPVYAKVKKKRKKDVQADIPLDSLYAEIPANTPKVSSQKQTTADSKIINEGEDGVDSGEGSWCPLV